MGVKSDIGIVTLYYDPSSDEWYSTPPKNATIEGNITVPCRIMLSES